jgi:hypothetical protein
VNSERFLVGGVGILLGIAYLGLGALAVIEVALERRVLGVSRFGLAFAGMAATCGPHHLLHGAAALGGRASTSPELALAALVGSPAGLVFVALRIEAAIGGRGDRTVGGAPGWLLASPALFSAAAGALVTSALVRDGGLDAAEWFDLGAVGAWANVIVALAYSSVGWPLLRTQLRRHQSDGVWSLSGLSLAAVFPTCALMHVVLAASHRADRHHHGAGATALLIQTIDVVAVPVSLVFVWIVRALYREAIVDWNRRPAAGTAGRAARPSPWAGTSRP